MITVAAALVAALAGGASAARQPAAPEVEVELLSSRPAHALSVEGPGGRLDLAAAGGEVLRGGVAVGPLLRLEPGRWTVKLPGGTARELEGALDLSAEGGRLRIVARLDLERYVAWTVASETEASTPVEALRAQAVVARSYALASGRRHPDVDLCDLAHCQVLRGGLAPRHLAAARRAAEATRGQVLRLGSGRIAAAPFHAACGGHTGDPAELFGGDGTGAVAVPDDGCPARPWRAMVTNELFAAVVLEKLGVTAHPEELEWRRGRGGYVVQVAWRGGLAGGEAFARALDARLGHRAIRSSRFTATQVPGGVLLEGSGVGHGVGLCQAGAARRAAGGASYRQILAHDFPLARIGPINAESQ